LFVFNDVLVDGMVKDEIVVLSADVAESLVVAIVIDFVL
jgi:hypothetical protein